MAYDLDEFKHALKSYQIIPKLLQRHPIQIESTKFVGITSPSTKTKLLNMHLKIPDIIPHAKWSDVWNPHFLEGSVDVAFFVDILHIWFPERIEQDKAPLRS